MRSLLLVGFIASSSFAQWPSLAVPLPPQGGGEKDAALIVSIEDYAFLPDVVGARENATAWLQHLVKTRGIPGTQVKWLQNNEAALESLRKELKATVAKVKPGGVLWVVFIGHGAPSEDGADGLLVGADAQNVMESFSARSLRRSELLAALEAGQQKASVVLLDACFSGQSPTGELLVKGSMPTLPERETQMTAKKPVLVLSAGTSRQVAGALPGKDVPAFSYLALGGLRGWADENRDGVVTAGEVVSFSRSVMGTTVTGRTQTPTLNPESAVNTAVGKAKPGEELPLVDILVWLKGAAGGTRANIEPPPEVKATGPKVSSGGVKPVVGSLTVKTTPPGARLDLVDPKGQPLATRAPLVKPDAMPGRWRVTATMEGHASQTREVDVPPDDVAFVEVTLQKPASLEVVGTPEGALVKVTGPEGFQNEGGLPWKAEGLTPGEYNAKVSRDGYSGDGWTGVVAPGQAKRVTLKLTRAAPQCIGNQVPPKGYRQMTVQMTKSGSDVLEAAKLEARRQFREQLCAGSDCEGLDSYIIDWCIAEQGDQASATVAIRETDFQAWQNELSAAKIDDQFRVVVHELFPQPQAAVRVVLGNVEDNGALGSRRALWIAWKMQKALTEAGITQVNPPEGWSGRGVPPNATSALIGYVLTREENGRPQLDVTWTAIFPDGHSKTSTYISMLASVAPKGPQPVKKVPVTDVVAVEIEHQASHHGAMCNGQRTQLYVSAKEDRCLLVFNIFGELGAERGLLVFPNEARPNCMVRKGERLKAAGEGGFLVVGDPKAKLEVGRLVVVAAPAGTDLPLALQRLSGGCVLTPAQLAIVSNESLEVDRYQYAFRVLDEANPECAEVPPMPPVLRRRAQLLGTSPELKLPVCAPRLRLQ